MLRQIHGLVHYIQVSRAVVACQPGKHTFSSSSELPFFFFPRLTLILVSPSTKYWTALKMLPYFRSLQRRFKPSLYLLSFSKEHHLTSSSYVENFLNGKLAREIPSFQARLPSPCSKFYLKDPLQQESIISLTSLR